MAFKNYTLENLLNELPEALLMTTTQGVILFANKALSTMTGFALDELRGESAVKLIPTPERRRVDVVTWLNRWADDPDPDQLRYLNLALSTKFGVTKLVSLRVSKHLENGEICFLVILRDVTSEHETITSLRHAQLITNRILAIGEDAVVSIDEQQRITFWNARAADLFGYSSEEALGQPISLVLPDSAKLTHGAMVEQFARQSVPSRMMGERGEISGKRKDGIIVPLEAAITKTHIDGQAIMSAQVRDISRRKSAEAALRASEARFRAIFEHAVEAMAVLDATGMVQEINQTAREMIGDYEPGHYFWDLNWWPGETDSARIAEARTVLQANIKRVGEGETIRARVELPAAEGRSRDIDFSLIAVFDADNNLQYIIAEGRDVSSLTP